MSTFSAVGRRRGQPSGAAERRNVCHVHRIDVGYWFGCTAKTTASCRRTSAITASTASRDSTTRAPTRIMTAGRIRRGERPRTQADHRGHQSAARCRWRERQSESHGGAHGRHDPGVCRRRYGQHGHGHRGREERGRAIVRAAEAAGETPENSWCVSAIRTSVIHSSRPIPPRFSQRSMR